MTVHDSFVPESRLMPAGTVEILLPSTGRAQKLSVGEGEWSIINGAVEMLEKHGIIAGGDWVFREGGRG